MKKFFIIGCLTFITACQTTTITTTPTFEPTAIPTATFHSTLIPATNTPEHTPTMEPSVTPLPQFFTTRFDPSLTGWSILQAGNESSPSIEISANTLRLQMDSPYTWLYVLYDPQEYTDVYLQTEFINSALSPASMGLVCRYSEMDGWFEYNVTTDGIYNLLYGRWLDTGIADYQPIVDGSSNAIRQSGEVQQIGMTCSGKTVQLYISGTNIRNVDVERFKLTNGKIGITASSFESTPVIAVFNSITVNEP